MSSRKAEDVSSAKRVVVVGAGVGGLLFAIALKKKLGFDNFTIFESAGEVGGTWRDNTYPGCSSDVPTHWYSLSSEPNPHWPRTHVYQPQIQEYWKSLARKHFLYAHCVFHTLVLSATWDAEENLYHLTVKDVRTGETRAEKAHVVVSAIGLLYEPRYAKLEGFAGPQFHSARWDHNVDLRNKRVAVIGNGCSAAQFIPVLSQDTSTQIVNICRSPNWFAPPALMSPHGQPYSRFTRWVFDNIPYVMKLHRAGIMFKQEMSYWGLSGDINKKSLIRSIAQQQFQKYIKETAPEKYQDVLMPTYPPGCKRVIVDSGYLKSLHRPNVELVYGNITNAAEKSVILKDGKEIPVDVVIHATGFATDQFSLEVYGKDGRSIQEYFKEKGGPFGYWGVAVPELPNFYMLGGPNSATGHGSVIYMEEIQTDYILQLIQPILNDQASNITVTDIATDSWNASIQHRLSTSIWSSSCTSWYRVGKNGRVSGIWPGSLVEWWWSLREPVWRDYKVVKTNAGSGNERWDPMKESRKRKVWSLVKGLGWFNFLVLLFALKKGFGGGGWLL